MFRELADREEGLAVGGGDQLGAGFGGGVGVVAAQRVGLAVAPVPFPVFVALVGGDGNDGAHGGSVADGLKDVCGSHYVRRVGAKRIRVGEAHQRLRGHVDDDFRLELGHGGLKFVAVEDVAADVFDHAADLRDIEQVRVGIRI